MRPTILDIARLAEVSRTTVSNVMNGNGKCTPETEERVLRIAAQLGYRPNLAARSLVNQRSNMIGLVLPSYVDRRFLLKSPFFGLILEGISASLREGSSFDFLINCVNPDSDAAQVADWALQHNLAGLIFVGDFDETALAPLRAAGLPLVFIDNYSLAPNHGLLINTDNVRGAYLAVNHLVERGRKRIVCCSSNTAGSAVNQHRYEGYRQALAEAGLPETLVDASTIFFEDGLALAPKLAASGIDAVFAVGDALALGLIKGFTLAGKRVPEDIAVVGFDNLDAGGQSIPELSTIDHAIYDKGRLAVELLEQALDRGTRDQTVLLPVSLIVRQST